MSTTRKKKEGLFDNLKRGSKVIIEDKYPAIVCRHNKSVIHCETCMDKLSTQTATMCRWVFFDRTFNLRHLCNTCGCGGSEFKHCSNAATVLKKNQWLVGMMAFSVELTMNWIATLLAPSDRYVGFANQYEYQIIPIAKCQPTNTPLCLLTSSECTSSTPKKKFLNFIGGNNAKDNQG